MICVFCVQEIGFVHMRIADGLTTRLQLEGLVARLARLGIEAGKAMRSGGAVGGGGR